MNENTASWNWNTGVAGHHHVYITPRLLEQLKRLKVNRLLDLGSGNGSLCGLLSKLGFDPVGIEIEAKGVQLAQQNHPSIPFYRFGVQDDPAELLNAEAQRKFDAVICMEVVEHLFSPHLLPAYAKEVLSEKGYLLVTTPYHGYLKNVSLSLLDKWDFHHNPLWHGGHIKFWSRATLSRLLNENGFEVLDCSGVGRVPYFWKSMIVLAQKK